MPDRPPRPRRERGGRTARAKRRRPERARRGDRFSLRVHPLFFALGAWFLWRGEGLLFLVVTVVAVIHECGHAFYAARIGCRLSRLLLLPCGAVVRGEIGGISLRDEIFLALAGPAVNAACALLFAALWWFFPETYAYTDTAFTASATLCLVNLLPAYPLDGGRVLYCAAARLRGERAARRVALAVSVAAAAALAALFAALAAAGTVNVSLLFFAAFILGGCFGGRDCRYERIRFDLSADMKRGLEVRRVALDQSCTVKKALSYLERGKYLEIDVFGAGGEYVCSLSQADFYEILQRADIYRPLSDYLS